MEKSMYTKKLATYIKAKGIALKKLSANTGIAYSALTDSLSDTGRNRPLRVDEFFKICDVLEKPPLDFFGGYLKKVETNELAKELSVREGVTEIIAGPYESETINIKGPAVVLVVID